jgi:hypothetical protein
MSAISIMLDHGDIRILRISSNAEIASFGHSWSCFTSLGTKSVCNSTPAARELEDSLNRVSREIADWTKEPSRLYSTRDCCDLAAVT